MSTSKRPKRPEIALAIRVGVPHLGRVAQGIRDFADSETDWRFLISPETHDLPPASLEGWRGDGVIAQCNTAEEERVLSRLNCPVVNISGALRESKFPRVRNDYRDIGNRAAEYLRERGFRRFGFYGVKDVWYSEEIERGFCDSIEAFGFEVDTLHSTGTFEGVPRWDHGQEELEAWLVSQKPPFAVMAAHDPRATMVIRACERVGLRVPADVAVVGVNDDTVTCETSRPTLTSIRRNGHIVPAEEIRERESTQTLAIDHPALASAVGFIETNFRESIGVDQIVDATNQSRRWLEEAFRKELNCSPSEFLKRARVNAVVDRIRDERNLGPGFLAAECGFSGTRQLNAAFEREMGLSLKQFCETIG